MHHCDTAILNFVSYLLCVGKSLLWVAILLVIIVYIYAVISFAFLRREFFEAEGIHCTRLDECFITVLRFGLIDSFLVRC